MTKEEVINAILGNSGDYSWEEYYEGCLQECDNYEIHDNIINKNDSRRCKHSLNTGVIIFFDDDSNLKAKVCLRCLLEVIIPEKI